MSKLRSLKDTARDDGLNPHEWLSCRAVAWLVSRGFRFAATEVPVGREDGSYREGDEQADACGVGVIAGRARCCVVEVKVSRADFLADFKKGHRSADFGDGVTERFYLIPVGLVAPGEIPEPWGLAEWDPASNRVAVVKRARGRRLARQPAGVKAPPLTPPWEQGLEDEVPGGRNAWVRAWWRTVARIVNAYSFGYLALGKSRAMGGYAFGTAAMSERLAESLAKEDPPS